MQVNWGIAGCGDIAWKRVCPAILEQPDSELVAVFSRSLPRAREFVGAFGATRAYDDFEALIADRGVNAVYVASPVHRHHAETIASLEAGRHVLCEKPMAMDVAQGREMIEAARRNERNLAVAYYRRYYPKTRKMKELIDSGAIGTPVRGLVFQTGNHRFVADDPKVWRGRQAEAGGGLLMDIGSHRLDVMCHLLGEPLEVVGATDRLTRDDIEVPDIESLVVRLAGGAHVSGAWNWDVPVARDDFEIHGTRGCLLASPFDGPRLVLVADGQTTEHALPKPANVHFPLIDDFARSVVAGVRPTYDGEDGLQATRIIAGVHGSSERGESAPGVT